MEKIGHRGSQKSKIGGRLNNPLISWCCGCVSVSGGVAWGGGVIESGSAGYGGVALQGGNGGFGAMLNRWVQFLSIGRRRISKSAGSGGKGC